MARDTSPVAAELQIDILRRLGGAGRLRMALEMGDLARYALLPLPLPEALDDPR